MNFTYYSLFRVSDFVLRIYLSLTSYIFLVASTPHQVISFCKMGFLQHVPYNHYL